MADDDLEYGECPNCGGEVILNDEEHNRGDECYDCVGLSKLLDDSAQKIKDLERSLKRLEGDVKYLKPVRSTI